MVEAQPVVDISEVTFGYPPKGMANPVLEHVSLSVGPRDFLGLVGPNGGGKTTLLKLILGLHAALRGTVRVFGSDPCAVRDRIGYVPQHGSVDSSVPADVLDVVLMGRLGKSPWGMRYGETDLAAADEALRLTETRDLAHRSIGTLSGGQRQRVLIARALAADALLLLLDEPTAGVDAHMERGFIDLLVRLNERLPIVMVSHDIGFVSSRLKRVACLNRTLTCHAVHEITPALITDMYHGSVRAVMHGDECAHGELPDQSGNS